MNLKDHLNNIVIALDDLLNAAVGGQAVETLSAHAATARRNNRLWGCWLCAVLDAIRPGHCDRALKDEELRAQAAEKDVA